MSGANKTNEPKRKKCFVTGATGVVGVPLVRELLRENYDVTVLARDAKAARQIFGDAVEIVPGDLSNQTALAAACAKASYVFHFAAKLHVNNPCAHLAAEYLETNVRATERLLEIAERSAVEKFVFASTINVYGAGDGARVFDETSALKPAGIYAETKAAAEKAVLRRDFGVVLRFAAVYGSRMKGNYVRVLRALQKNRFFFVGDASNRRTLIHHDDAARAAVLAATRAPGKSIYNAADNNYYAFREIVGAMAAALGKKEPKLHLPLAPIKNALGLLETLDRAFNLKIGLNRSLLDKLLEDAAVGSAKIRGELGFVPQYDLAAGWREAVRVLE